MRGNFTQCHYIRCVHSSSGTACLSMPPDIQSSAFLTDVCHKLKTYLFRQSFCGESQNVTSSSGNGDIAFLWEWSKFDPNKI